MKKELFWQRIIIWSLFFLSQSQLSHASFLSEEKFPDEETHMNLYRDSILDEASDYAIARLVQEEEDQKSSLPRYIDVDKSDILELGTADQQILLDLGKRLSKFPQGMDVHQFNKAFAKEAYQKVYPIDKKTFRSSVSLSVQKIQEEINLSYKIDEEFKRQHQPHVTKIFAIISKIPSTQIVEPETQTNILQLLSRVWSLAQKIDQRFDPELKEFFHHRNLVLVSFADNIRQGGGCHAGIAGRLIQNYVTLSLYYFNLSLFLN